MDAEWEGPPVNRVQKFREAALMAKAELARKAGVSESTIDRVEAWTQTLEGKGIVLVPISAIVTTGAE